LRFFELVFEKQFTAEGVYQAKGMTKKAKNSRRSCYFLREKQSPKLRGEILYQSDFKVSTAFQKIEIHLIMSP